MTPAVSKHVLSLTSTGAIPPGTRLGKYEIIKRLRSGGMAEIYIARAHGAADVTQLGVIKRVLPHLAEDPEFIRMFLNEARITASLDHPNIAHVKEVARAGAEFFLALEFVHGVDLQRILQLCAKRGGVPLGPALAIIRSAADALHYAHERSIVHRDMTPSNVMVTYEGHVKVLDFGIAKAVRTSMTRTGTIKGKIGYMSPEQCMADAVDRRSDVFALGILLYELTLGRRLFKAESEFAVMNQIMLGRVVPPSRVDPAYPEPLERIVLKAVAVDPGDRFQTAHEMARAVEDVGHALGLRSSPAEVAEYIRSVLGEPPPPITAADLDAVPNPETQRVLGPFTKSGVRARTKRPVAVGVLGAALGIAVGIGLMVIVQGSNAPSRAPATAPAAAVPAVVATERATTPVADEPTEAPSPEGATTGHDRDEDDLMILGDDAEAEPAQAGAAAARPTPARPTRKKRSRPKRKSKADPDSGSSLFPPSRGGG